MNRNGLMKHAHDWITRLGSQARVADRCGISTAALSLWLGGKYGADTASLDKKIAKALGYKESDWVTVENVKNFKTVKFVFDQCKEISMWMAISSNAGSGKTRSLEHIFNTDLSGSIVLIQAEEWAAHQFLERLHGKLTSTPLKGYMTNNELLDKVIALLNEMDGHPILVIDEADKQKPSALRQLIPIYNRTEEHLGCVLAGTENLQKEIKAGVRKRLKGYDEIDSRLGRSYITLDGATEKDVYTICEANGVTSETSKLTVWSEIEKVEKFVRVRTTQGEREVKVLHCEDFRRLRRLITREKLLNKTSGK